MSGHDPLNPTRWDIPPPSPPPLPPPPRRQGESERAYCERIGRRGEIPRDHGTLGGDTYGGLFWSFVVAGVAVAAIAVLAIALGGGS